MFIIPITVSARLNLKAGFELFLFSFLSNLKVIFGLKAVKILTLSGTPREPELLETPGRPKEPSLNPRDSFSSSPFYLAIKFFYTIRFTHCFMKVK